VVHRVDRYLVKWKGYGDDRNTWQLWEDLGADAQRAAWHVQLRELEKLPASDPKIRRAATQDKRCSVGSSCACCLAFAHRVDRPECRECLPCIDAVDRQ
jgi:hypothetical protein